MNSFLGRAKILIADDDALTIASREAFLRAKFDVRTATSVLKAKAIVRNTDIDVVLIDLAFEGQEEDGLDLIDFLGSEYPQVAAIVLSGDDTTKRVSDAMRRPIVDFIAKQEADLEQTLLITIDKALDKRASAVQARTPFEYKTKSPAMQRVISTVDRVLDNPSSSSILVIGESGTGKEYLAKHIAARTGKPVVSANMATIGKELAESTLFGHVKGSFTGAVANRIGLFEQAHNGILFLDEIADCPLEVQSKLLRAVQEREITPIGSNKTRKVNVRFVAATHRDLGQMVETGEFRLDLYQRINAFTFRIPALRDRPEDIVYFTNCFLNELAGDQPFRVESSGIEALLNHSWPGNIRELRNLIERLCILADRRVLDFDTVSEAMDLRCKGAVPIEPQPQKGLQRADYIRALEATNGNREHAAKKLNIHRTTFFRNLKAWGLQDYIAAKIGRPGGAP